MRVLKERVSHVEALALKTYLESHGLTVQIVGTHSIYTQILNEVLVLVNESEYVEAESLLAEFTEAYH
ncbi:MAG: hypothetical protein M9899_07120 [Bdellovibrionaceae bacterium]|nr:hypothetical protein [Pseudobdellovibrionaceae bacterium]